MKPLLLFIIVSREGQGPLASRVLGVWSHCAALFALALFLLKHPVSTFELTLPISSSVTLFVLETKLVSSESEAAYLDMLALRFLLRFFLSALVVLASIFS